jgi:hypothetical protein
MKHIHAPMGVNATWDLLNVLTPAVPFFGRVVEHVEAAYDLVHSSKHTLPDGEADIRGLVKLHRNANIFCHESDWKSRVEKVIEDVQSKGARDLQNTRYLQDFFDERMAYRDRGTSLQDYSWPAEKGLQSEDSSEEPVVDRENSESESSSDADWRFDLYDGHF